MPPHFSRARGVRMNGPASSVILRTRHWVLSHSYRLQGFMHKRVRKAVFPVAGLGTRFLPATKAMPKEMLPIVDKPLIHYAVEEAKAAGIEQFYLCHRAARKSAIDDISTAPSSSKRRCASAARRTCSKSSKPGCPSPGRSPTRGSRARSVSAMPCGAPALWSATSRLRCCLPTI